MMKFRQIPTAGRVIIVTVAIGVLVIALVACWTSYNAIYRLVADLGLYGDKTNQVFPLLVDAAFLVAELAAILGAIMRTVTRSDEVSPGWPVFLMVICGLGTIVFNIAHAYLISPTGWADPLTKWRCLVATLPPLLMILSFQVLIAIVKWVMLRLGSPEQAFGGVGSAGALFAGQGAYSGIGAGTYPPQGAFGEMPSAVASEFGQTPQWGSGAGGGVGAAAGTKRAAVEQTLEQLGTEEARALGPAGVAKEVAATTGVKPTERYVRQIMDGVAGAPRNGHGKP